MYIALTSDWSDHKAVYDTSDESLVAGIIPSDAISWSEYSFDPEPTTTGKWDQQQGGVLHERLRGVLSSVWDQQQWGVLHERLRGVLSSVWYQQQWGVLYERLRGVLSSVWK